MSETGSVKCEHLVAALRDFLGFSEWNACRRRLLQVRLVGVGGDGIGFRNLNRAIVTRVNFYITGL